MKVIISGGGTGGHVYPGIAIANEILKLYPDAEITFVGVKGRIEEKIVPREGYPLKTIHVQYLTRALNHNPTNYDIYYNLGLIYMRREEYEEAIALYTRGLFQSEDNHAIHFQLARAFEAAEKIEYAREHYQKAIDTSPNPDGAWHYTGMDFTEQAREALKRLI